VRPRPGIAAACLGALLLICAGLAVADDPILDETEPPVRLKKKHKPDQSRPADQKPARDAAAKKDRPGKDREAKKNRPKKDAEAKKPAPQNRVNPDEERKRLVRDMLKKMRSVEERLAKNDPGRGTRELQREILDDLDKLIEQTRRQPPPQGGGGGSSSRRRRSSQRQQNQSQQNAQNSPGGQNPRQGNQPKDKRPGDKSQKSASAKSQPGRGGTSKKRDRNKLAELFKDVWGHLPETMRQEMDAYSRAKFPPKYRALLKQYYRTLSEEGRRKKEGE
jgi:hypothetical protein